MAPLHSSLAIRHAHRVHRTWLIGALCLSGCGLVFDLDPQELRDDGGNGGIDAGTRDAGVVRCTADADCSDGNPCNGIELCSPDGCLPGTMLDCDDGIACTVDSCDPELECQHVADDTACTRAVGGTCSATLGGCQYPICDTTTCVPERECQTAQCSPSGTCIYSSLCTDAQECCGGECIARCRSDNPCLPSVCNPVLGACAPMANDALVCSDGSACTHGDHCAGGSCVPMSETDCDDGNECTRDACDAATGECQPEARLDQPCGSECTAGVCVSSVDRLAVCQRSTSNTTCTNGTCTTDGSCTCTLGFNDCDPAVAGCECDGTCLDTSCVARDLCLIGTANCDTSDPDCECLGSCDLAGNCIPTGGGSCCAGVSCPATNTHCCCNQCVPITQLCPDIVCAC